MGKNKKDTSFFNTDFGRIILGVVAFLAFTYSNNTSKTAEDTSTTMGEILKAVTEMSLKLEYNSNRITNLENSDASFRAKPRFTNEDDEAKLIPIRTEIYDIKSEQKSRSARFRVLEESISEIKFKLRKYEE